MKALVYQGPGRKPSKIARCRRLPRRRCHRQIVKTTICGTDLHILKGDVPTCTPGASWAMKASAWSKSRRGGYGFRAGDRVIIPASPPAANAIIADGHVFALPTAAGYSAIRSTARRPNMSASRMPIPASTAYLPVQTRKRW